MNSTLMGLLFFSLFAGKVLIGAMGRMVGDDEPRLVLRASRAARAGTGGDHGAGGATARGLLAAATPGNAADTPVKKAGDIAVPVSLGQI